MNKKCSLCQGTLEYYEVNLKYEVPTNTGSESYYGLALCGSETRFVDIEYSDIVGKVVDRITCYICQSCGLIHQFAEFKEHERTD